MGFFRRRVQESTGTSTPYVTVPVTMRKLTVTIQYHCDNAVIRRVFYKKFQRIIAKFNI
jgi:hypothetical protein